MPDKRLDDNGLEKTLLNLKDIFIPLTNSSGAHNSIYRGKNLGTSVTAAQWAAIEAGTFDDMYVGDYWEIGGVTWRIAAFDYWLGFGNPACTVHHIVIVPDTVLLNIKLNNTATTAGAYAGCDFRTGNNGNTGKAQCAAIIEGAFGSEHILMHMDFLKNTVTNVNGATYESAGVWANCTFDLMTEQMVFGGRIYGNCINGTNVPSLMTIDHTQLPLFALDRSRILLNTGLNWWLRDVVDSTQFARVGGFGQSAVLVSNNTGCGIRPAFGICAANASA